MFTVWSTFGILYLYTQKEEEEEEEGEFKEAGKLVKRMEDLFVNNSLVHF